jgi:hypothetical protein
MPALPRLQVTTPAGVKTWADALVNALEIEVRRINALATSAPWSAATPAPVRTLNAATATLTETAQALATLVQDLTVAGVIP